jgi:LmbE family N-acetylglucosaminyl deacetylase
MDGWETNHDPDAFWNIPIERSSARLAALIEKYRPQVVVTYDENGAYGHPDHIQAHRITMAATEATGIPAKLYYTAIPRSGIRQMIEYMKDAGISWEQDGDEAPPDDFGTPDELITAVVDVTPYIGSKVKALQAHQSQTDNMFLLRLPEEAQQLVFSHEYFIRMLNRVEGAPAEEDDLFAGLR